MSIRNFNKIATVWLVILFVNMPQAVFALEGNIRFGSALSGESALLTPSLDQQPGFIRVIMPPVTPKESEQAILSRKPPTNLITSQSTMETTAFSVSSASVSAPIGQTSVSELARALRNDPYLIHEYIRNNIKYYPVWGVNKGPVGTMMDKQGTAFDQASLMVALLRESGFTASYVKGRIDLTAAHVRDWLGIDTSNACAVINLLTAGQIPIAAVTGVAAGSCPGSTTALVSIKIDHVWVKVTIGGKNYQFDPSFKSHTLKTAINLPTATGYTASNYLTAAKSGATVTPDYVQGINRSNIRNTLNTYAINLTNYLRSNKPAGELIDVLGGTVINESSHYYGGPNLYLTYSDRTVPESEFTVWNTDIPVEYRPTLRIRYRGIDRTFTSDAIYGKRLTLTYNTANQPLLKLDGVTQATGIATVAGSNADVTFDVVHSAYASPMANESFTQKIKAGGTFLIGNGWGGVSRGLVERYRTDLDEAKAAGNSDDSEIVLGSSLAVLSASWIAQSQQLGFINDRLANTNTLYHHQIGIAGYNTGAYVDLPGNLVSVVSQKADTARETAAFFNMAMHSSILESTAVEQVTGASAVSTVKLIDMASDTNKRIYDAKKSNFASIVKPNLTSCSAYMTSLQAAVDAGRRLILPSSCYMYESNTQNSWKGFGYFDFDILASGRKSIGAFISGGMLGGFSSTSQPVTEIITNTQKNTVSTNWLTNFTRNAFGDPIDMAKGHFLYTRNDITSGIGDFPMSLNFQRLYSSGMRTQAGSLGKGWTHNLAASATVGTDGFQGLGEDSALDAVKSIVEMMVSLDLLSDSAKPLDKMVIATLGQRWFGDQLIKNTVIVKQGLNGEVFTMLPDFTYNAPPGNSAKLSKTGTGGNPSYSYETVNRALLNFNSTGTIATYTLPSGLQAKFTYSGADLTKVENSLGRILTLTNASGRVTQVADGTRTIKYAYDANGNLTTFTDATAKNTTFQYDLPGRMTKLFYPSFPTVAFLTNVYDSLGRVQTQTNAHGQLYTYYFAGSRSQEVGPGNVSRVAYVNGSGKVLKEIDPLGRKTLNEYDGQSRLVKKTLPEGNSVSYGYDDAPCAAQKRCTHNISFIRVSPKSYLQAGIGGILASFHYESSFNRVRSVSDGKGEITTYTYSAQGNLLTATSGKNSSVERPVTTFGYISYTRTGFPTFYLQNSETSKITATNSVVNTTTYNTANKYVPTTTVLDSGTGKLNLTTHYTYDGFGNLTLINGPRTDVTDTTSYIYDAERRVTQTTNALGKLTRLAYDADGRNVRSATQIGSQWLVSCNTYTSTGKILKAWGPAQTALDTTCPTAAAPVPVMDYAYDVHDRLQRVTENLTSAEGGNRISETVYNADNTVASVKRAVGTALAQTYATYTYSPNGLPITVKDAKNNLTTYEYDGIDRKIKTRYPDKNTPNVSSTTDFEEYGYDKNSNVTSHRKRNGETVTLIYDNLNRLTNRNYPTSTDNVSFSYDLMHRRLSANHTNYVISYSWDNADRMVSTTAGGKTTSNQYDPAGNRTRITYPESTFYVTTTYDVLNRPTAIKELGTTNLATYAYDDLSRRTTVTRGNVSTITNYGYNTQATLSSLGHNLAGTA